MGQNRQPSTATEIREDLGPRLDRLNNEIAVLREAIDEIREEFTYAVQNGRTPAVLSSVLKRMAADPTADDWSERLVIVRGYGNDCGSDAARSSNDAVSEPKSTPHDAGERTPRTLF